jgi:periplasmic protein TonB
MRQPAQFTSGFIVHLVFALVFVWFFAGSRLSPAPAPPDKRLVWTKPGPGGGGGGKGEGLKASPAPSRPAAPSAQTFTLPKIPAVLAALELPGAMAVLTAAGAHGSGMDNGLDNGKGDGRPGPGAGTRSGSGSGEGDGPFQDGDPGVSSPRVLYEKRPEYTAEAMSARLQGTILIEATVLADGTVANVRLVRSLEPSFGLDRKAIEAVRAWRFRPGTYLGQPAPVRVLIELSFNLR